MTDNVEGKWLLLIHQIPPKPGYLRVKIWRRLQSLGAVAIKNSVYVIPRNEQTLEDFQWVLREIVQSGAEASICAANFLDGLSDDQIEAIFQAARQADYAQMIEEAQEALDLAPSTGSMNPEDLQALDGALGRLKRRYSAVSSIDFFGAPGREETSSLLDRFESLLSQVRPGERTKHTGAESFDLSEYQSRTWVTRKGVYIDRMASAWLIRRFIDSEACFRFVSERSYRSKEGELRFDMFDGEFTHEGDKCTFEVLVERFSINDKAVTNIARIVHELDLKQTPFRIDESSGVLALINGMVATVKSDEIRLARSSTMFNDLYENFRRK
ncbi:MAG: chromate resistance protein ChrB domain-containing protein [Desulfomonilaceae bacterium]